MKSKAIVHKLNSKGYFTCFYVMPQTEAHTIDVQGSYAYLSVEAVQEALGPDLCEGLEFTHIVGRERDSIDIVRIEVL